MAVHLKGHYCCSRPFARYIREKTRPAAGSSTSPACPACRELRPGELRRRQSRHRRIFPGAGAGAGEVRLHGEHHFSRRADAHDHSAARRPRREASATKSSSRVDHSTSRPSCRGSATDEAPASPRRFSTPATAACRIMQQPAVIKQFKKTSGVWTLDELDQVVPQLMEAKKANDAAAKEPARPSKSERAAATSLSAGEIG